MNLQIVLMSEEEIGLVRWLRDAARDNEWLTRHAAEDRYCPDCATDEERWTSQSQHHEGCVWVSNMKKVERLLSRLENGK